MKKGVINSSGIASRARNDAPISVIARRNDEAISKDKCIQTMSLSNKMLFFVMLGMFLFACNGNKKSDVTTVEKTQQTYTCPMHPQVIKHEMGTCPICGMDLVPFEKNSDSKAIKLDVQRQLLANISTLQIGEGFDKLSLTTNTHSVLNGRLVVNPQQSNYISARIPGRVEQLYVKETGVPIRKGQPLYQIYSEQLATLQQEYLMALAQQKQFAGDTPIAIGVEQQLVAAAKQKLLLYGQTESQLQKFAKTQQKSPFVTVYATQNGVIAELSITQGQYVAEGSPIMRLEGYDQLWVEADLYPNEAKTIKQGQKLKVIVNGWEDKPQWMTVDFINPALQAGTQLTQIRGSIANPNGQWQPGLQVHVLLTEEQQNNKELILPIDAVIRDGKGQHVWVKTSGDSFEPKAVTIGTADENKVTIKSGLAAGEEVVITGAYLLYSEYVLKRGKHPLG